MNCETCISWSEDDYFCHKLLKARTPNNFCSNYKNRFRRCKTCNQVYVPARSICKDCLDQLNQLIEVSTKGTLLTYTVCNVQNPIQPMEAPVIYGIIRLDGADTRFVHMLGEVDHEQLKIGMRVQAVFKEEREASILDIKYFKPLA